MYGAAGLSYVFNVGDTFHQMGFQSPGGYFAGQSSLDRFILQPRRISTHAATQPISAPATGTPMTKYSGESVNAEKFTVDSLLPDTKA